MRSKLHFFFRIIIYHFLLTPISELLKTKFAKLNSGVNLNLYLSLHVFRNIWDTFHPSNE